MTESVGKDNECMMQCKIWQEASCSPHPDTNRAINHTILLCVPIYFAYEQRSDRMITKDMSWIHDYIDEVIYDRIRSKILRLHVVFTSSTEIALTDLAPCLASSFIILASSFILCRSRRRFPSEVTTRDVRDTVYAI